MVHKGLHVISQGEGGCGGERRGRVLAPAGEEGYRCWGEREVGGGGGCWSLPERREAGEGRQGKGEGRVLVPAGGEAQYICR